MVAHEGGYYGIDQNDALRDTDPEFPLWGSLIHDVAHHRRCRICPHPARLARWAGWIFPQEQGS